MSDQPKHPDLWDEFHGGTLHRLLDKAGAVQADAKGLMTVAERIARLGDDNLNHVRECRQWRAAFDVPSPALVSLPRTADGRKIVPGMWLYYTAAGCTLGFVVSHVGKGEVLFNDPSGRQCCMQAPFGAYYSTRDAAEKARAGK